MRSSIPPQSLYAKIIVVAGIATLIAGALFTRAIATDSRVTFFGMLFGAGAITVLALIGLRRQIIAVEAELQETLYDEVFVNPARAEAQLAELPASKAAGAALMLIAVLIGAASFALCVVDWQAYYALIKEDALIENGSVAFWGLAALIFVINIVRHRFLRLTRRFKAWPYLLWIAFFVLCAGEEISWGQRIFGFGTPDALKQLNVQGETNLHNLGSVSIFANAFLLLTLVFFVVVPLWLRRRPRLRAIAFRFSLPVPHRYAIGVFVVTLVAWIAVGLRFGTLGMHPYSFYGIDWPNVQLDDELFELLAALSFCAFAILETLRVRLKRGSI